MTESKHRKFTAFPYITLGTKDDLPIRSHWFLRKLQWKSSDFSGDELSAWAPAALVVSPRWMRQRDLQQALLRGASINDTAFATLVQALNDCPSLQTLDLSQPLGRKASCSRRSHGATVVARNQLCKHEVISTINIEILVTLDAIQYNLTCGMLDASQNCFSSASTLQLDRLEL